MIFGKASGNPARRHWKISRGEMTGKAVRKGASQETGPLVPLTRLTFRGERRRPMSYCLARNSLARFFRGPFGLPAQSRLRPLWAALLFLSAPLLHAGVIRGTVTDPSGATV